MSGVGAGDGGGGAGVGEDLLSALRPETLAALREFLVEREAEREEEKLEGVDTGVELKTSEDWELSQFWYDADTSTALAWEVVRLAHQVREVKTAAAGAGVSSGGGRSDTVYVACLSCPSLFKALRSLAAAGQCPTWVDLTLLEYDPRFAVFGDAFVEYDFNHAGDVPRSLHGVMDIVALDPPFLNPECLAAFADTVRLLQRSPTAPTLLCTGAVMAHHAKRLLSLRRARMHIGHAKALSNPFALFVNYPPHAIGGWDDADEEDAAGGAGGDTAALGMGLK